MLKTFPVWLLFFFAITGWGRDNENLLKEKSREFLNLKELGKFEQAYDFISPQLKEMVSPEAFREAWLRVEQMFGNYIATGEATYSVSTEGRIVNQQILFESGTYTLRIRYDDSNFITGYFFRDMAHAEAMPAPDYANTEKFTERELTIPSGDIELPAKLTIPLNAEQVPLVILVHGSGPADKDMGIGPNRLFRDIAWGLSSKGIAVLRYDKRTYGHASSLDLQCFEIWDKTGQDAAAAVKFAAGLDGVDPSRIFILGHSLGGYYAPRIAERTPEIAGIIIAAGNSGKLHELIPYQYEYLASLEEDMQPAMQQQMDSLLLVLEKQARRIEARDFDKETPASEMMIGWNACLWMEILDYNQVETASRLELPILILQGERDYQVPMREFFGWQTPLRGRDHITFKWYPGLNHHFIRGSGKPNPQEYFEPGNVSKDFVKDVAQWIKKHP